MSKKYQKKTKRSRRKLQKLPDNAVEVEIAGGQAMFQLSLPMNELMAQVADEIERAASQAGILMMKAMIDEEVEQLAGPRHVHNEDRDAYRWGHEEGHVVFAGRKVALSKPRVRNKDGHEMPLRRYQSFRSPQRM